jgi:hypothetical protein
LYKAAHIIGERFQIAFVLAWSIGLSLSDIEITDCSDYHGTKSVTLSVLFRLKRVRRSFSSPALFLLLFFCFDLCVVHGDPQGVTHESPNLHRTH